MSVHPPGNAVSALRSSATEQASPADQDRLLGTLLENITDAFFALDTEWRFLYINRRAEQIWHVPREQLLGRSLWEVFPQAVDSPFYFYYHKAVAEQRSLTFETLYAPDLWAEVHVYPSEGGLSVYLTDITGRKREEKLLHEREETLQAIIAASPDDITIINPNLRVDFVSPVVREVLGYTSEQRQDRDALENIHPEDRELVARELRAILSRTQESSQFRFRTRHADGTWIVLESNARPITDAEGRALGAIAVSRDVTEQAQLEESLRQAKQEAERANQAKNDFLSRMSHELRTPLNAILGFSQLLEMDIENPQQRESVQHIHKAGHHLLELINEVLDISRIETDRLALSLKAVQLSSCLEEVTSLLQPLFSQSGVHLRADSSVQNQYYVLADTQRLKQILLNLLSNAAKYNRKRGTVTVSCETPRPGWLRLNVADTGGGIPADKLGRLFTPFDRLDAERTTVEGTGLGLALSKRLAEAMNGTLGVHSEVGVGSTFWVELPLTRKGTGELTLPEETAWSTENASAQRPTILYIEDNAANVALVRRILSHRHVNLLVASSGEGGLEMARKRNPSLVLLDLGLPDLSGEEVLRQLRSSPATRRTPVVIVSADALPKNIQRLWAAGINEYLTKPLDINRFLTVVDRILETA